MQSQVDKCDACMKGKYHKLSLKSKKIRPNKVGEVIHINVCGPMSVNSFGSSRYFSPLWMSSVVT